VTKRNNLFPYRKLFIIAHCITLPFKKQNLKGIFLVNEMGKRIIRKPELLSRIGLSGVTIWRLEKAGLFPKRIQLGGNSVGWFDDEIDQWLSKKAAERV